MALIIHVSKSFHKFNLFSTIPNFDKKNWSSFFNLKSKNIYFKSNRFFVKNSPQKVAHIYIYNCIYCILYSGRRINVQNISSKSLLLSKLFYIKKLSSEATPKTTINNSLFFKDINSTFFYIIVDFHSQSFWIFHNEFYLQGLQKFSVDLWVLLLSLILLKLTKGRLNEVLLFKTVTPVEFGEILS